MYVVRIESDEAARFRAFDRSQDAQVWASDLARDAEGEGTVGVYRVFGVRDACKAVEAVRDGKGLLVGSGAAAGQKADREGSIFLAGMGIGTGAGF